MSYSRMYGVQESRVLKDIYLKSRHDWYSLLSVPVVEISNVTVTNKELRKFHMKYLLQL